MLSVQFEIRGMLDLGCDPIHLLLLRVRMASILTQKTMKNMKV